MKCGSLLASVAFVFVACPAGAFADSKTFDSWTVDSIESEGKFYAATVDGSNNILGQYCFPASGNCSWLIGAKTTCEKDAIYPVLVNTDIGASQLSVVCNGKVSADVYQLSFTDFSAIDSIVRNAKRVGIAIPLQGDEFVVYRFGMTGAVTALSVMRTLAETKTKPARRNTREQRL